MRPRRVSYLQRGETVRKLRGPHYLAGVQLGPTIVRTLNWTLVAAQALPRGHCCREAGAQKAWMRPFGHGLATWQAPEDERWSTHSFRSRGRPPCSLG
jgi:hypothetical protein